jgi:hypothetical protein
VTMCRRFQGRPVVRLITTMPAELVQTLDLLLARQVDGKRQCRAEFVRVAVAEKVGRDLMTCGTSADRVNRDPT